MKKILAAALGVSVIALSSCSGHKSVDTTTNTPVTSDYSKIIAIPDIVNDLLNDSSTPTVGPKDAKKAVVVFFDYGCGKCVEISKEFNKLIKKNPNVKFIFKAYPSTKRDDKVANYASLIANEAYLQGGSELFLTYNNAIFDQRQASKTLTYEDIDSIIKQLGIKADQKSLKHKASSEELETRRLGKLIGFHGPHSFVVLPTDLANMSDQDLAKHANQIYVIPGKQTNSEADNYKDTAIWVANNIQYYLRKS